jgi:mannose-6-phosphate isomerase-like protein (cupin superfamily)
MAMQQERPGVPAYVEVEGDLRIDFRDGAVHLSAGEMFVVRKGVEHKPYGAITGIE